MRVAIAFAVLLLSACAATPQVSGDSYARAFIAIETLAEGAGDAQVAGTITEAQEDRILDQLQSAQNALNLAFRMHLEDDPKAPKQLAAAQSMIRELQRKYGDLSDE